jgi:hypothetical protein
MFWLFTLYPRQFANLFRRLLAFDVFSKFIHCRDVFRIHTTGRLSRETTACVSTSTSASTPIPTTLQPPSPPLRPHTTFSNRCVSAQDPATRPRPRSGAPKCSAEKRRSPSSAYFNSAAPAAAAPHADPYRPPNRQRRCVARRRRHHRLVAPPRERLLSEARTTAGGRWSTTTRCSCSTRIHQETET